MMLKLPPHQPALALIGLALAGCTLVAIAGAAIFQPPDWTNPAIDFPRNLLTRAWVHWDSGWYTAIAAGGYWYEAGKQSPVAFFPTYPMAVGALHAMGLNRFWAGILVSAISGCAGLFVFNQWAKHLRGDALALRATLLLALYPFSFYLYGVVYSDALFLLAVVSAFYALEKEKVWLAVLIGALATAARPVAPAVVLGLVARGIELRVARGERLRAVDFAPALAGLGLAAYMGFLWYRFGDALAFVHVQSAPGWAQPVGPRAWLKLELVELIIRRPAKFGTLISIAHGAIALAALAMAIPTWRHWSKAYAVYILAVVGIPALSSKDFMGLGRYVIAAFPIFLTLALMLEPRPRARLTWLIASAVGLTVLTMAFAADRYVA
jgi:Mannosyltransferase (PIG-V)